MVYFVAWTVDGNQVGSSFAMYQKSRLPTHIWTLAMSGFWKRIQVRPGALGIYVWQVHAHSRRLNKSDKGGF